MLKKLIVLMALIGLFAGFVPQNASAQVHHRHHRRHHRRWHRHHH